MDAAMSLWLRCGSWQTHADLDMVKEEAKIRQDNSSSVLHKASHKVYD